MLLYMNLKVKHVSLVHRDIPKLVLSYNSAQTKFSISFCFFVFQIKRLKDLEKEKDALWSGLEILEKARLWYLQRLEENRAWQDSVESRSGFVSRNEDGAEVQRRASLILLT